MAHPLPTQSSAAQPPGLGAQTAETFAGTGERAVAMAYLLALPEGYDEAAEPWPLVLFLHGSGERGDDVARVAAHGPPRLVREGQSFPFVLVSPQAPAGAWWDAEALLALLDDLQARLRTDPDRVYVTGLEHGRVRDVGPAREPSRTVSPPRRRSAAAARRPASAPRRDVPVWAFHGALDDVVPLRRSEEMVDALARCGGDVRLTVYPEAGHDSWTEAYADPDLVAWLLSHLRGASV